MARIAMVFGVLLTLLGIGAFALSDPKAWTALIPSFVGVALLACGVIALKDHLRMHAMHGAVLIGLLGCIAALARLIHSLANWTDKTSMLAVGALVAMALLCGAFVGLCVKSFIDARRARRQSETNP